MNDGPEPAAGDPRRPRSRTVYSIGEALRLRDPRPKRARLVAMWPLDERTVV